MAPFFSSNLDYNKCYCIIWDISGLKVVSCDLLAFRNHIFDHKNVSSFPPIVYEFNVFSLWGQRVTKDRVLYCLILGKTGMPASINQPGFIKVSLRILSATVLLALAFVKSASRYNLIKRSRVYLFHLIKQNYFFLMNVNPFAMAGVLVSKRLRALLNAPDYSLRCCPLPGILSIKVRCPLSNEILFSVFSLLWQAVLKCRLCHCIFIQASITIRTWLMCVRPLLSYF